ncbi:MAG: ATP-binding protein [Elusimicrobiota bacterium]
MKIFVSSVQKEFQNERKAIKSFVEGDALLRRFFEVFLFEDLPASDRRADNVYLDEVDRSDIYVGIFGANYGLKNSQSLSPVELEFNQATDRGKTRLIFIKDINDKTKHPKMLSLIQRAGQQLIRRRFTGVPGLTAALYASLVEHLERAGSLRTRPFDASPCPDTSLSDIDNERVLWFLGQAKRERQFALSGSTPAVDVLAHLNLLYHEQPTHAAILLFGSNPQRFLPTSEIKCMHFHGGEVSKPIPSYQIYKGRIFELVDQAVDFVMAKLARSVGTRAKGPRAPVEYEVPREAVAEAIVNAVAHRDYAGNASVQVMLFNDRLEVWNPGELPPPLTPERLRAPHASIPRNPLIADPLFLAHYVEKAGSGTLDMITLCRRANLPEPEFRQDGGQFVQTIWRNWFTQKRMDDLALSDRQKKAIAHLRQYGRITTKDYMMVASIAERTALRDFEELVTKEILEKVGTTGRSAHYVFKRQTRHKPVKPAKRTEARPRLLRRGKR